MVVKVGLAVAAIAGVAFAIWVFVLRRPMVPDAQKTMDELLTRLRADCKAKGGVWDPILDKCVLPSETTPNPPNSSPTQPGTPVFDCTMAYREYHAFLLQGDNGAAFAIKQDAKNHGCSWA